MINIKKSLFIFLVFIAVNVCVSAIIYRLLDLRAVFTVFSFLASVLILIIILRYIKKNNSLSFIKAEGGKLTKLPLSILIGYLVLYFTAWILLVRASTLDALVSPWQPTGSLIFLLYFLLSVFLLFFICFSRKYSLLLIILHCLISFLAGTIIFRLGFGYDIFVHEAALKVIAASGEILPKTNYYLGYYGLLTTLNKIFFIPLGLANKALVPVLAALSIPFIGRTYLEKFFDSKVLANITLVSLMALGYPVFVYSTPQNLAYIFLVLTVFSVLSNSKKDTRLFAVIFSLASLLTHPLAGIPAVFLLLFRILHDREMVIKKSLTRLLFITACASLPAAFLFLNPYSGNPEQESSALSLDFINKFKFVNPDHEGILLNTVYLLINNLDIILAVLFSYGVILYLRHRKDCSVLRIYIYSGLAFFIGFIITMNLNFSYLIAYERADYADRILISSLMLFLPLMSLALYYIYEKTSKQKEAVRVIAILTTGAMLTASFYMSYPRKDNYHDSHSYTVGQYDIEAVNWIDQDCAGKNCVVLANQQVSAAALKQFGFKKYYMIDDEDVFYYPIPTGGRLYDYYLKMVYEYPGEYNAQAAKEFAGAEQVYFVLNKYWWASPKLFEEAKNESKEYHVFGDNDVVVYKY